MTTALQILSQSLGLLKIKEPGTAIDGAVAADLLERLNMMLDGWRVERLFAKAVTRVTATLTTQTATIGPAGQFVVTPRPIRIEEGSFYTVGGVDYPITPVSAEEYNAISLKQTATLGPAWVYFEPGDPTGTLYFYPLPGTSLTVTLLCMSSIADFADLTTSYTLAPGTSRALVYSFAEEVAPDFDVALPPGAMKIAATSRRALKRSHVSVPQFYSPTTGFGPDVLASAAARFQSAYADYYSDNYA